MRWPPIREQAFENARETRISADRNNDRRDPSRRR